KDLILYDRAADGCSELIPAKRQRLSRGPIFRIEIIVAEILERGAMKVVRARPGGGLHHRARYRPELRVVVAGRDLEFLQGIDIGVNHCDTENRTVVLGSIEQKADGGELPAVGVALVPALRL